MCDWDHQYCTYKGLEFVIHQFEGKLYFDVDYKGEFLLIDTDDGMEVTV